MATTRNRFSTLSANHRTAVVLLGFATIAGLSLLILSLLLGGPSQDPQSYKLEQVIAVNARMGRDGLQAVKTLPSKSGKQQVFQALGQPMGKLSNLSTKETGVLEQFTYPLAFEPSVQIVLLFKADTGQFVGYRFAFNGSIPRKS